MTREDLLQKMEETTERTIWDWKQNHPELVVQDCAVLFDLDEHQQDQLRRVLMMRGVNKWLWARRRFIDLKHRVKDLVREFSKTKKPQGMAKRLWHALRGTYAEMQHIAHSPRWVEWGKHVHRKMQGNDREVVVRGK